VNPRMEIMLEEAVQPQTAVIRPEEELLLCCARTRITPEISQRITAVAQEEVNWLQLTRLALRHGVLPLLYSNLKQICPNGAPKSVLEPWRVRCEAAAAEGRLLTEELVRILCRLESQGIPAMPYKGPALAQRLYGDLTLRGFSDLDIVILERDLAEARDLILDLGYLQVRQMDSAEYAQCVRSHHEIQFCRRDNKARLDLHWRFTDRAACVGRDPERFLQRVETISLAGSDVPSLRPEVCLLVLSMHAAKHKWAQLKLIRDIAEILAITDLDWGYVVRESADLGLKRALAISVLLAKNPLGAEIPSKLAEGLEIDGAARTLAERARAGFCEEPDENWGAEADYAFQFELRERLRDRTKIRARHWSARLEPNDRDRQFLHLPNSLNLMYYLVRPLRLAVEKISWNRAKAHPLREPPPFELVLKPHKGWRTLDLHEMWQEREIFRFLVWRDIKIRYKQTLLGGSWAVLQPFLAMLIFSIFFGRIANISDRVPYPLFAYSGLVLWSFFSNSVSMSANSLVGNQVLVSKIYFPRMFIPLAAVAALLLDLIVSLLMLAGLMVYYRWPFSATVLCLPLFILGTLAAASGLGLLVSSLNARFRDLKYAVPFFLQMGLFVTPVIYPLRYMPERYRFLLELNPMAGMVEGFRSTMLGGQTNWALVSLSLLGSGMLCVGSLFIFRRMERHLADII